MTREHNWHLSPTIGSTRAAFINWVRLPHSAERDFAYKQTERKRCKDERERETVISYAWFYLHRCASRATIGARMQNIASAHVSDRPRFLSWLHVGMHFTCRAMYRSFGSRRWEFPSRWSSLHRHKEEQRRVSSYAKK